MEKEILFVLRLLDGWLHSRLFVPVSNWLQEWFHVNRYHILSAFIVLETAMYFVSTIVGAMYHRDNTVTILTSVGLCGARGYLEINARGKWEFVAMLRKTADRFERDGFAEAPAHFDHYASLHRELRPFMNLLLPGPVSLCLVIMVDWTRAFEALPPGIWMITWVFTYHLWDVDSLDPEQRKYLFRPRMRSQEN